jgi:hypothetical protein
VDFPDEPALRELVRRWARLHAERGGEIGTRPLVLPTAEFFPDPFTGDAGSAAALVARMQRHAGIDDVPITTEVVTPDGVAHRATSCSSGACALPAAMADSFPRVAPDPGGDGWLLRLARPELAHPVGATAAVARALGTIFLDETAPREAEPDDAPEVTSDLAAVALGFGVLLVEAAYVYSKSCGGPSVARLTRLSVGEIAAVLALFAAAGGHKPRRIKPHLGTTQASVFAEAAAWAASNDALVAALVARPSEVSRGSFTLEDTRPWLLRVLGQARRRDRPRRPAADATLEELEASLGAMPAAARRQARPDPKRDELRRLVDDALRDGSSGGE